MSLENKYGVPKETIQRMVNDGVIPGVVKNHYEIYDYFERFKMQCPSCSLADLFRKIEDQTGVDFANVKKIVYKIGKIA